MVNINVWFVRFMLSLISATVVGNAVALGFREGPREFPVLAGFIAQMGEVSAEARYDLAVLLVETLLATYAFEVAQAQRERPRGLDAEQKLRRWTSATAVVQAELRSFLAATYVASEVAVHADRHGQVLLMIDGRPLWVAWPRLSAQNRLEQQVIEQFCQRHACVPVGDFASVSGVDGVDDSANVRSRVAASPASAVRGSWVFGQRQAPAWQTADGLRCEFTDLSARAAKEARCQAIANDLQILATALRDWVQRGESVTWSVLKIRADPFGGPPRLTLHAEGPELISNLSALTDPAIDWPAARSWLQLRASGRSAVVTVVRVDPAS